MASSTPGRDGFADLATHGAIGDGFGCPYVAPARAASQAWRNVAGGEAPGLPSRNAPVRGDDEKQTADGRAIPAMIVLAVASLSRGICAAASQMPANRTSKKPISAKRLPD